jgi:hypothetical protein
MTGDVAVNDGPSMVAENQEADEDAGYDRRHIAPID